MFEVMYWHEQESMNPRAIDGMIGCAFMELVS